MQPPNVDGKAAPIQTHSQAASRRPSPIGSCRGPNPMEEYDHGRRHGTGGSAQLQALLGQDPHDASHQARKADTSTAQPHQETDSRGKARVLHGSRGGNGGRRSHATPPPTRRHGRAAHTPHGGRRSPTSGGNTDTGAAGQAMANTPQSRQRRNRGAHTIEPNPPKQPWITHNTWDLIQKRSQAREAANTEEETRLNKEVRKQARRDKTQWLKDRLAESEQTMDARMKWKVIKRIRSDYKQRPVSIHNAKGKPVSQSKQAWPTHSGPRHPTRTPETEIPLPHRPTSTPTCSRWRNSTRRYGRQPITRLQGWTTSPRKFGSG